MDKNAPTIDTAGLIEFMFRLAQAYLASGEQTAKIELTLRRIATAYGVRRSRVVVFPTAVFITLHDAAGERVTVAEGPTQTFRLDQIGDVYKLGETAQRGEIAPQDGLKRLNEILAHHTGQPLERVAKDTDRNYWMSPEEALAYGIVGKIVKSASEL